nr:hypothetical protein Iba_chr05cCG12390 [Ipomoea batatas]
MRHLLRPLRNQAPIPVIALKALPVKRSSETPFLATCPCSWRYCYEGFGDWGFENGDEEPRFCDGESNRFEELG